MNLCAKVKLKISDDPTSWSMTIRVFDQEYFFDSIYTISKPHLDTLEDWKKLAAGNTTMYLNSIDLEDGYYLLHITDKHTGNGSSLIVKESVLSKELTKAIQRAEEKKLFFAEKV